MLARTRSNPKLVGAIFTPLGLLFLGIALWTANRQYTIMNTWPTVEAEVTKSQVSHYTSRSNSGSSIMYQTEVEFRYTIAGKEYTTPSTPGYSTSNYPAMKRIADTYAPGTRHSIQYNPADPNDIRFMTGYSFTFFLVPVVFGGLGLVFAGIGLVILKVAPAATTAPSLRCPACGQAIEPGQKFCPNCATPVPAG